MEGAEAGEAMAQQRQQGPAPVPFDSTSSRLCLPGAESFDGALRELKDLRSQLHQAADCCEKAFLNTDRKKLILESTKSYICDAVVAVIDHLGTVSSKLEHKMEERPDEIAQMERKLNFMKQRLLTCEQYAISLKLLTVRADPEAIQYHRRYISESIQRLKEENGATSSKGELLEPAGPTASPTTCTLKPYEDQSATVSDKEQTVTTASVDGSTIAMRRSFSLKTEDVHIVLGDHQQKKASSHGSNILSFLKKTRRHALRSKAPQDGVVEQW